MGESAEEVRKLLRQQSALARFGSFALRAQSDLLMILTEAARVCAEGLSVPFAKVWRYRVAENDFIVEAGYGWEAGVVGHVVSSADANSPHGRAFITGQPSICGDLRQNNDFQLPAFYAEHGIISTIDVVIKGGEQPGDRPYGVLEIGSDSQRDYDQHDIDFLTGFANVVAEAVGTSARTSILQTTVKQMMGLVEEKNRLLDQKNILAEEMQHRVRNNLQVVYGMLSRQADETADTKGKRGINAIARRVSTLAQVYDHLLGSEMTRTTDFGGYVKSLCTQPREDSASVGPRRHADMRQRAARARSRCGDGVGPCRRRAGCQQLRPRLPGRHRVDRRVGAPPAGRRRLGNPDRQRQRLGLYAPGRKQAARHRAGAPADGTGQRHRDRRV